MYKYTTALTANNEKAIFRPANSGDVGYDIVASSDPIIIGNSIKFLGVGKKLKKEDLRYTNIQYIEYETDLIVAPPSVAIDFVFAKCHTYIFPRSSVSKYNLVLANSIGLVDQEYRGSIKLRFKYVFQPEDFMVSMNGLLAKVNYDKIYKKGDKIGQLVFSESVLPNIEFVKSFSKTERNEGGFGSSGL